MWGILHIVLPYMYIITHLINSKLYNGEDLRLLDIYIIYLIFNIKCENGNSFFHLIIFIFIYHQ